MMFLVSKCEEKALNESIEYSLGNLNGLLLGLCNKYLIYVIIFFLYQLLQTIWRLIPLKVSFT